MNTNPVLEAALRHAALGRPVFPCNPDAQSSKHKAPLVGRRKKGDKPIPRTGGLYQATTDAEQIRKWWKRWPTALIGMPTGSVSGAAVLDLDKKNDKNGFDAVPDWEHRTLTIARTPSGGAHLYFRAEGAPHCTTSEIAPGVDTRGEGGYVIAPPSAGYSWVGGDDLSTLPPWPDDLRPPPREAERQPGDEPQADPKLVAAALEVIPNDDLGWDEWNRIGMAAWRATGGADDGFAAFDAWSQKSTKYDADATADRWEHYFRSPPDRIGAGTLFFMAEQVEPDWRQALDDTSQEKWLMRLNDEWCVVVDGGKTRALRFVPQQQTKDGRVVHRRQAAEFLSFGDFHNFYKNQYVRVGNKKGVVEDKPVGQWWTSHRQRRQYKGLVFRPDLDANEVVDGRLNLWRGWGVQPAIGNWSLMRQHIREVLANGNDEHDRYIMNWIAWAVQHPDEPAEAALVLLGGKGSGKGTLGNSLCRLFGQHASHISSASHLTGRFNQHLRDCCLLFADEAYWPGDKAAEGNLKRMITEPTLAIEPKFKDLITVPNMLHVLMASNEKWVVPASEHERRYAVFKGSDHRLQDRSWFGPLYEQLQNGGYAAMLYDLLRHPLGDWHPRDVPMTDALREQQTRSMDPLDVWVVLGKRRAADRRGQHRSCAGHLTLEVGPVRPQPGERSVRPRQKASAEPHPRQRAGSGEPSQESIRLRELAQQRSKRLEIPATRTMPGNMGKTVSGLAVATPKNR
jgi:hypothetical protein